MGQICTMVKLNPYASETFGTHIGTRPHERGELDPFSAQSSCFDGVLRLLSEAGSGYVLKCEKCGLRLAVGYRSTGSMLTMWALMTCQAAFMGITPHFDLFDPNVQKFLPNDNDIADLDLMGERGDYIFWRNWLKSGSNLAVALPLDWPETNETISKLGAASMCVIASLARIHASAVEEAAQTAQSSYGWLYHQ